MYNQGHDKEDEEYTPKRSSRSTPVHIKKLN
jgi:hypothetical protein